MISQQTSFLLRRRHEAAGSIELDDQMLLIDDAEGPTSIAGVMGGERSEVSDTTTRVLMEAATWDGANVHRTSLKLGLRSEASARFERGTDPEGLELSAARSGCAQGSASVERALRLERSSRGIRGAEARTVRAASLSRGLDPLAFPSPGE